MSIKGASRTSLPSISNPQLTYSQRYEHMTKIANYGEMNENQIWKQYEKLRGCLKELNEEVLYHMEKKAYSSLNKMEKDKPSKDVQGTLVLLDDEKKTNELRTQNFSSQFNRLEQRIKYLASKPNLLDELNRQQQSIKAKMKQIKKDNRDLKKDHEVQGRDLVNNNSLLDKLMIQQQKLNRVFKQHKKHEEHLKNINEKNQRFKQKVNELQRAIDLRVEQFSHQQNFIAEEIHLQRYEQLKKQKDIVGKYEPIYKRNYLMKLKQLESLLGSVAKHEKIISQTQTSIISVRKQIQVVSGLVGAAQRKRNFSSSVLSSKKVQKQTTQKQVETSSRKNPPSQDLHQRTKSVLNDKNNQTKLL